MLSRVANCNLLYYGLTNFLLGKFQRLMKSAGRLIFELSTSTPTWSYLKQLHLLAIKQRIVFKILCYAHRQPRVANPVHPLPSWLATDEQPLAKNTQIYTNFHNFFFNLFEKFCYFCKIFVKFLSFINPR